MLVKIIIFLLLASAASAQQVDYHRFLTPKTIAEARRDTLNTKYYTFALTVTGRDTIDIVKPLNQNQWVELYITADTTLPLAWGSGIEMSTINLTAGKEYKFTFVYFDTTWHVAPFINSILPAQKGSTGKVLGTNGDTAGWVTVATDTVVSSYKQPTNPIAISSVAVQMLGLAGSITPRKSGKASVVVVGLIKSSNTSRTPTVQIFYGTGTAPTNGAFITGSPAGNVSGVTIPSITSAEQFVIPFTCVASVSGLSVGTPYWIDLGTSEPTSGSVTITNISILATEE